VGGRSESEAAAAAWIAKRESGEWSSAQQIAFDSWIDSSTDNRVAWLRLNEAWQATDRLRTLHSDVPTGTVPRPEEVRSPFFRRVRVKAKQSEKPGPARRGAGVSRTGLRTLAASLLVLCAAGGAWKLLPSNPSYETDVGAVEAVPLADGSRVTLNTDTRIRVDLTPSERGVDLARGEAYFEVAKDPTRPFVVHAGDKRIIAVGTQFSVRRDADGVRVFVTEGVVRVEQNKPGDGDRSIAQLHPGAIAHAARDGVMIQTKPVAEVEQLLTWRTGYLVFDHTPLGLAITEFNRYTKRRIVILDPQIAAIPIGGNFRTTNVEAFLRLVESDFRVVASDQGDEIVLTGAPVPAN